MNRTTPGAILAAFVLLTLVWGTTWAAIRIGLAGLPPLTGVALRFAIAGTVLAAVGLRLGVRLGGSRREVGLWVVNGILSFCISYSVVYWSEQYLPSGLTAVLFATHPLMVAVLAHFVLPGERLSRLAGLGLLLGFGGVAVIFSDDLRCSAARRCSSRRWCCWSRPPSRPFPASRSSAGATASTRCRWRRCRCCSAPW